MIAIGIICIIIGFIVLFGLKSWTGLILIVGGFLWWCFFHDDPTSSAANRYNSDNSKGT